jgi:hypothetical protein
VFLFDSYFGIKVRRLLDSKLHGNNITFEQEEDLALANWARAMRILRVKTPPVEYRRLFDAGNDVIAAWVDGHDAIREIAATRRAGSVPEIENFEKRILQRFMSLG